MNKIVRESIAFQRGLDPKEALGVGLDHILTLPFDYSLIPSGKYMVWSNAYDSDLQESYNNVCIAQKDDEDFYMRTTWSSVLDGNIRYMEHLNQQFNKYTYRITNFYEWVDNCNVKKLTPLSDEEFEKLLMHRYEIS